MNIDEKYNKLIEHFKEISKIPRNSKQEEKIADYLCEFAKKRNLWYKKDNYYNVLIKKPATKGYENKKTILFQAHTDMVCQKTQESTHDFENDAIEIIENADTMTAKDTTLGADDGIGVSYLLLLLEDNDIPHPNIECLFTTQEEIGMNGARAWDYSDIEASYLINLDGEEENTAIVGCAGGISIHYTKDLVQEESKDNFYELRITNLYGGHSGVDINKGRTNSNLLAAKILNKLNDIRIYSFIGGEKDNAIANNTTIIFSSKEKESILKDTINTVLNNQKFCVEDSNIVVSLKNVEVENNNVINKIESKKIIELLLKLKQNVIEMSKDVEGLVETSGNVGIVRIENGNVLILESLRSSDDFKREDVKRINNELAISLGFKIFEEGSYPGWKYNPKSKLEKIYIESYKNSHNGETPIVCAIHAGVECGMIYEKLPHLDMISLGPDVKDVHTVNETLYLQSCKRMLITIIEIIQKLD